MSFRFGNQFQYIAAPPITEGPGGIPGTNPNGVPLTNSVVTSIPGNAYIDFADVSGSQKYKVTIKDTAFYGFRYFIYKNRGIDYSPPHLINSLGVTIPSTGWTWQRSPSTTNGTVVTINREHSQAGKCSDTIDWYNSSTNVERSTTYSYLVLEKAVAVGSYADLITPDVYFPLAPNSVKNVNVGDTFYLIKEFSRGKDVSNTWTVFKSDPAGSFTSVPAVAGVDYALVDGTTLANDECHLQLMQPYNFEFRLTTVGYTFNNNPYQNYPSITEPNTSVATYYFNTTEGAFNYEVKIPKIDFTLDVPPAVLLGSDPFETYQNQLITVTPILDLSSGYWKKIDVTNTLPPSFLTKTDEEWRDEITAKCNVILEARKKDTNELETTRVGLDPFTISLQQAILYNLQFKTTLK